MAAPLGNRFWEARSRHGRRPIFASPEQLWEAASDYFEWVENNPLYEDKTFAYEGAVTHEPVARMRAMTLTGLQIFLDISAQAWSEYCDRDGFGEISTKIKDIIRTQKFEGASADLLNANIIARELGLMNDAPAVVLTIDVDETMIAQRVAHLLLQAAMARPKLIDRKEDWDGKGN